MCRGSDLSNCIRADVIRDMLNVVSLADMIVGLLRASMSMIEAQELMNDLCSN